MTRNAGLAGHEMEEHHKFEIIIGSTMDCMDRAYIDAKQYGWSRQPFVEMLIPSTLDDSLAPPGQHVASLFCQQFAPTLPDGRSWQDARIEAADCIIDTVNAYAPNFKASILGRMILSPLDLEQKLFMVMLVLLMLMILLVVMMMILILMLILILMYKLITI